MSEHTAVFDPSEPRTGVIALVGIGIMVALIAIILGIQAYVGQVEQQEIYAKVQVPVSQDLKDLRAREHAALTQYHYIDRAKGTVRLPIDRAMDLLVEEAHANK